MNCPFKHSLSQLEPSSAPAAHFPWVIKFDVQPQSLDPKRSKSFFSSPGKWTAEISSPSFPNYEDFALFESLTAWKKTWTHRLHQVVVFCVFCGCVCGFFFHFSFFFGWEKLGPDDRYALCYISYKYASKKQQQNAVCLCTFPQLTNTLWTGEKKSPSIRVWNFFLGWVGIGTFSEWRRDFPLLLSEEEKSLGIGSEFFSTFFSGQVIFERVWGQWIRASTTLRLDTRSSTSGATPRRTWRRFSTPWWTRKTPSCPPPCPWGWGNCQTPSSSLPNQSPIPDK